MVEPCEHRSSPSTSEIRKGSCTARITRRSLAYPLPVVPDELLDYPFPDALRASIEQIDLRQAPRCSSDRILVYTSCATPAQAEPHGYLRDRMGRPAEFRVVRTEVDD